MKRTTQLKKNMRSDLQFKCDNPSTIGSTLKVASPFLLRVASFFSMP